jgi:DNA replication protein DnaC
MRLDTWHELSDITYDRALWGDLTALDLSQQAGDVIILGPVGVGKTHLATALGHIAIRRRVPTAFYRADQLFNLFKAARLDNSLETEYRRLSTIKLLIIDDFALRAMDPMATNDFYELAVARHRKHTTIWTSNRDPAEWIALMADTLLAQAAIDRVTANAHTMIIDGPSYRQRQPRKPTKTIDTNKKDNHG